MSLGCSTEVSYRRLTELISSTWGIEFSAGKRVMLESRLGKRARALGLGSLKDYYEFLQTKEGFHREAESLIDSVTTHKTDFFREPAHFDYLTRSAVPELGARFGAGLSRPLVAWSAASSTGEEPYTMAMVLAEYARSIHPQAFRFVIHATDISSVVLETARTAVYPEESIKPVPAALRSRYLLRSRDRRAQRVRIAPALRAAVHFRQLNLLDLDYGFREPLDVVLCRNVMIYFDRPHQQTILDRICRVLRPGGYLIMGHSESLNGLSLPIKQIGPTVYRRRSA